MHQELLSMRDQKQSPPEGVPKPQLGTQGFASAAGTGISSWVRGTLGWPRQAHLAITVISGENMIGVLWLEIHFPRGDEFFWLALNGWWLIAEKKALHFAPTVWVISVQMTIKRLLKSLDVCVTVFSSYQMQRKKKKDIIYPLQASESWVSTAELSEASFRIYALLRYPRLLPLCSSSRQGLAVTWPHGLSFCSPVGTDVCFCKCLELFKV